MSPRERAELRPAREWLLWIAVLLVVLALGAGAFWWRWQQQSAPPVPAATAPGVPQPEIAPPAAPPPVAAQGPQHPVDAAADATLPPLNNADAQVESALAELLGGKAVLSFLQVDGFVRRFVATVDNLPRDQAAARMWPVHPAPKRFEVAGSGDAHAVTLDNAARYTPFVLFVESVDARRAVALYRKLYPLFQQAYEELGYPGRYFNDRLVAAIDHLLQAPEPAGPLRVKLVELKGDEPRDRPTLRYEFADPKLETLSSGQKMLIRTGLVNERRLKAKLRELRGLVAAGAAQKK